MPKRWMKDLVSPDGARPNMGLVEVCQRQGAYPFFALVPEDRPITWREFTNMTPFAPAPYSYGARKLRDELIHWGLIEAENLRPKSKAPMWRIRLTDRGKRFSKAIKSLEAQWEHLSKE